MDVQPDFRELLELLNSHGVDYVVVGAWALAFHGAPRLTGDMDVLVRPDLENATLVISALHDFGMGSLGFKPGDLSVPDQVIQMGVPPVRIDILSSISGVSWDEVAAGRVPGKFGDVDVFYIGREEFIANKRATGRKKDLGDIEAIGGK